MRSKAITADFRHRALRHPARPGEGWHRTSPQGRPCPWATSDRCPTEAGDKETRQKRFEPIGNRQAAQRRTHIRSQAAGRAFITSESEFLFRNYSDPLLKIKRL